MYTHRWQNGSWSCMRLTVALCLVAGYMFFVSLGRCKILRSASIRVRVCALVRRQRQSTFFFHLFHNELAQFEFDSNWKWNPQHNTILQNNWWNQENSYEFWMNFYARINRNIECGQMKNATFRQSYRMYLRFFVLLFILWFCSAFFLSYSFVDLLACLLVSTLSP